MTDYHIAQVNISHGCYFPLNSPEMQDFVNNLDRINALADQDPNFVWRLQTDEGNATSLKPYDDEKVILNMSVWKDIEGLKVYTYNSEHVDFIRRRKEWFESFNGSYTVLWWVPAGYLPTISEAKKRLAHLEEHGETPFAFTFKKTFSVEEAEAE